jgi:anti-anti-sigma factor
MPMTQSGAPLPSPRRLAPRLRTLPEPPPYSPRALPVGMRAPIGIVLSDWGRVPAQPTTEIEIHSPTACIVTLRGEHDASSSEAVTMALMLARSYTHLLVDLAGCHFVDSSVINVLLLAGKRAREHGGALELVVPTDTTPVRRTLEIANVQGTLPFHATRAAGIASIDGGELATSPGPPLSIPVAAAQAAFIRRRTRARTEVTVLRARVTDETATTNLTVSADVETSSEHADQERRAA